jgi:DNA-binding NarL/FixJ family response regulator
MPEWYARAAGSIGAEMVARILLADDHVVVRRGLRALLEARQEFVICAEAGDGREAVELTLQHKPDVAVLDISLPILNGIEATRQIRRNAPTTEVLIFTMHDDDDVISAVLQAGARGYLLKSEADDEIVDAITTLLRHRPYFSSHVSETLLDKFKSGTAGHANTLTAREREIVQLIAEGSSNKRVALLLDISIKTVETHRAAAMRKLGIRSTAELVRYAVRNKLIQA